ncbi:uncharacterized protein [Dysidea avara]|uniref:uncharacterized protein n=1 Tax=Dysidea avara TaxID=196820 RepID=UPI00332F8367
MSKRKSESEIAVDSKRSKLTPKKLDRKFFDQPCKDLAIALLGTVLVREHSGSLIKGKIVETEAYLGGVDKAAHSYEGKKTSRNEAMFMCPGTCYVYSIYGVHNCVNISSRGEGAAVLIRALEPVNGVELMRTLRGKVAGKDHELCKGPGNLCKALNITKEFNKVDLTSSDEIWLEQDQPTCTVEILSSSRIGVDYAGPEWSSKLLRFFVKDSWAVSKHKTRIQTHNK